MAEMPAPSRRAPPHATYRLQFRREFTLRDAAEAVDYLHDLGVSHLYASPYLAARAGSTHGYDIINHNALNPEVGTAADFETLIGRLHAHDMGQILDFVPNHMGVGQADNPWWLDLLEYGEASPYARYFDIDWHPAKAELTGKVLLPVLGEHYGTVLERGDLKLRFDAEAGTFSVWYHDHRFPLAPSRYGLVLDRVLPRLDPADMAALRDLVAAFQRLRARARSQERRSALRSEAEALKQDFARHLRAHPAVAAAVAAAVDEINGGESGRPDPAFLHRLLEPQPYRLAYWRVAAHEINYRRFFDINDLAGIRVEDPAVFEDIHRLVLDWIAAGKLDGLRLDHIDGLFDPEGYCVRLQERVGALDAADPDRPSAANTPPLYVLVEKILAAHEHLRESWPIAGTTGYEFMNAVNGLFVQPANEAAMGRVYENFVGRTRDFDEILYACKQRAMDNELASELNVLATMLDRIAETNWRTRDFTLLGLRDALREVIARFTVYRTYVTGTQVTSEDRRDIDWAVSQAKKRGRFPDPTIFDFLHDAMTTDLVRAPGSGFPRREVVRFAMKLQQYTGPVMAKSLEDTSFYRYFRLISLNEVGGDPRRFGISVAAFHHMNQERLRRWPHTMLATATHDMKRGEDVRARINVLSEHPAVWQRNLRRWAAVNGPHRSDLDGAPAPSADDEYLLYQTLIGAWPVELLDGVDDTEALAAFRERVCAYMTKAQREAKLHSSWTSPNPDYEQATQHFVERLLDPRFGRRFLDRFLPAARDIAAFGAMNSLAQTALKLTVPGVPDTYQGTEMWDLSLVDPDNRRPVAYDLRRRLLAEFKAENAPDPAALMAHWRDGRVKLYLTWKLLGLRRARPDLFLSGSYLPLEVEGEKAAHALAFLRRCGTETLLVVVPRLVFTLMRGEARPPLGPEIWGDTFVRLPADLADGPFHDVLSGRALEVPAADDGRLPLGHLLSDFLLCVAHRGG